MESRINKYLAECNICSRRNADLIIAEQRVRINGRVANLSDRVAPGDIVELDGKVIERANKVVVALNKPVGVTTTEKDEHALKTVSDILDYPIRLTYAGRLDKDSEGLLLMTNDGELIDAMMKGSHGHEKEYIVEVDKEIKSDLADAFKKGVYFEDLGYASRPADFRIQSSSTFKVILTQGINRQIRRTCESVGYKVKMLKRIRVVNITLGDLKVGEYRELTDKEREELYSKVGIIR